MTVINKGTYNHLSQQSRIPPLQKSQVSLKMYTGESIQVLGTISVQGTYNNNNTTTVGPVHVVDEEGPNLIGRDWLKQFQLSVHNVEYLTLYSQY